MRKITFGCANSLDNYIARPDGAVDWLMWSDEAAAVMKDYWATIDTILMGRKTYEVAAAQQQQRAKSKSGKQGKSRANPYGGIKTYVFSRTLTAREAAGAELVADDAVGFVRALKRSGGKDICLMGGGSLAKTFFEAGLIDEIGFNIHPVLLGRGVPLYPEMNRQVDLELVECRPFKNGCVYVLYRVK